MSAIRIRGTAPISASGARVLAPAWRSMVIRGSVEEWGDSTGMIFPQSGRYVVPEALSPIEIHRETDRGFYIEPNLWMRHI